MKDDLPEHPDDARANDPNSQSMDLLDRVRAGDDQAATELFERYVAQLLPLVRRRMSSKLTRRIDPEDVVQSAYRSFFRLLNEEQRVVLRRAGDLWRLLVGITVNKCRQQIEWHTAGKRAIYQEDELQSPTQSTPLAPEAVAQAPSPEEAATLVDEVEQLSACLDERTRTVLELRLGGMSIPEIAEQIGRTERTVRRLLVTIRDQLNRRWQETSTSN